jgi:hypothetical protein
MRWVSRLAIRGLRRWWLHGALAALVLYVGIVTALLVLRPSAVSEGTCPILEGRSAAAEQGRLFDFDPHAVARAFATALVNDDDEMLQALTADAMRPEVLDTLVADFRLPFGEFLGWDEPTMGFVPSVVHVEITLPMRFRSGRLALTVKILSDCRVVGAGVRAGFDPTTVPYTPPAYVDVDRFGEQLVVLGREPWALGGTLTMPHGPGPFPAVVLVPGSGYSDRDASHGPNAVRRDLAWGLASSGVASLRHDKRTLTHALAFARLPAYTFGRRNGGRRLGGRGVAAADAGNRPGENLRAWCEPRRLRGPAHRGT